MLTFSGSKCKMTQFGPTIKWQKSCPHHRKKPKIDLWEITGCAQIQEIERPDDTTSNLLLFLPSTECEVTDDALLTWFWTSFLKSDA
jgi:hypothetical protein